MTLPPNDPSLSDRALLLFPLGTVLFPDGRLPLRIFEVRYLDMIKKCHRAGREFGVVSLIEGSEVKRAGPGAPERFHAVGTRARIETFAQPQPGLYEIVTRGTTRFRITAQTQTPHGLWMAEVEDIPADAPCPLPPELAYVAGNLVKLMDLLRATDLWPADGSRRLDDAGWVANRWCELLPLEGDDRQRLMEMRDPLLRLELVGDLLDRTEFGQG